MRSAGFEPATGNMRIISAHLFKLSLFVASPAGMVFTNYIHVRILYPRSESNRHAVTAIDFESIVATVTPRGFVWAFCASLRSGPVTIMFNIYFAGDDRFVAPARIERASSEPKSGVLAVAPRGNSLIVNFPSSANIFDNSVTLMLPFV